MAALYVSEEIALTAGATPLVEILRYFVVSYDGLAWTGLMAAMGLVMRVAIESNENRDLDVEDDELNSMGV